MSNVIGALLLAHMIADYPLQTDWIAANKHDSHKALYIHSVIHGIVVEVALMAIGWHIWPAFGVGIIVLCLHGLVDNANLSIRWDQTAHLVSIVAIAWVMGMIL